MTDDAKRTTRADQLVEMLRNDAELTDRPMNKVMVEAADTIESLQAENEKLRRQVWTVGYSDDHSGGTS